MPSPRLSVVVPVYDAQAHVAKAVGALLLQTFADFELILVDDASADGTLDILRSFGDPRIRVFHNPINSGAYYSPNVGLFHSRGEIVAFVDSDDLPSPLRFARLIECFDDNPAWVYIETRYLRFFGDTGRIWMRDWTRGVGYPAFRRTVKDALGYFLPLRANGDSEYSERVRARFGPDAVRLIDQFTYWGLQHPGNLTSLIPGDTEPRRAIMRYARKALHCR